MGEYVTNFDLFGNKHLDIWDNKAMHKYNTTQEMLQDSGLRNGIYVTGSYFTGSSRGGAVFLVDDNREGGFNLRATNNKYCHFINVGSMISTDSLGCFGKTHIDCKDAFDRYEDSKSTDVIDIHVEDDCKFYFSGEYLVYKKFRFHNFSYECNASGGVLNAPDREYGKCQFPVDIVGSNQWTSAQGQLITVEPKRKKALTTIGYANVAPDNFTLTQPVKRISSLTHANDMTIDQSGTMYIANLNNAFIKVDSSGNVSEDIVNGNSEMVMCMTNVFKDIFFIVTLSSNSMNTSYILYDMTNREILYKFSMRRWSTTDKSLIEQGSCCDKHGNCYILMYENTFPTRYYIFAVKWEENRLKLIGSNGLPIHEPEGIYIDDENFFHILMKDGSYCCNIRLADTPVNSNYAREVLYVDDISTYEGNGEAKEYPMSNLATALLKCALHNSMPNIKIYGGSLEYWETYPKFSYMLLDIYKSVKVNLVLLRCDTVMYLNTGVHIKNGSEITARSGKLIITDGYIDTGAKIWVREGCSCICRNNSWGSNVMDNDALFIGNYLYGEDNGTNIGINKGVAIVNSVNGATIEQSDHGKNL